jgi:hypothetical protein
MKTMRGGYWLATLAAVAMAVLTLAGCGQRAASQTSAGEPSATPDCASHAARQTPPAATAVVAEGPATSSPGLSLAATPTPVPRSELVTQAVKTATAVALAPTPTSTPTRTPVASPITSLAGCATPAGPTSQVQPVVPPTRPDGSPAPLSVPSPVATLVAPSVLLPSDAGSLVLLHVADRFVLLLGQNAGFDWQIQMSDPGILQRVGSDGQGVYEAVRAGETTLIATGAPTCLKAQPPCRVLRQTQSRLFTIRVQ